MSTTNDHGRTVLSGVIPNRIDLLGEALNGLSPDHFPDSVQRNIYLFLGRYYQTTGGVLSLGAMKDIMVRGGADPGRMALYEETYEDFKHNAVDDADFHWSMHELREDFAELKTKEALVETLEILNVGKEQKDGDILKGQEPAREYLMDKLSEIDVSMSGQDAPHRDMRDEKAIILQEYNNIKE